MDLQTLHYGKHFTTVNNTSLSTFLLRRTFARRFRCSRRKMRSMLVKLVKIQRSLAGGSHLGRVIVRASSAISRTASTAAANTVPLSNVASGEPCVRGPSLKTRLRSLGRFTSTPLNPPLRYTVRYRPFLQLCSVSSASRPRAGRCGEFFCPQNGGSGAAGCKSDELQSALCRDARPSEFVARRPRSPTSRTPSFMRSRDSALPPLWRVASASSTVRPTASSCAPCSPRSPT